jgi:hypothetical protein
MSTIPVIDLSSFEEGGSQAKRQKAAEHLVSVTRELGFASLVGHGVPQHVLDEAFKWSKKLFDLPLEEKMKAPHPAEPFPHRGYSKPGQEKAYSEDEFKRAEEAGEGEKAFAQADVKVRKTWYWNSLKTCVDAPSGIIRDWLRERCTQSQYLASRGSPSRVPRLGTFYLLGYRKGWATSFGSLEFGLSFDSRRDEAYFISPRREQQPTSASALSIRVSEGSPGGQSDTFACSY